MHVRGRGASTAKGVGEVLLVRRELYVVNECERENVHKADRKKKER